jgi:hypothetical protein
MKLVDTHYVLENQDILNNLGYDLAERAITIPGANPMKKVDRLLTNISNAVYGLIEKRLEKNYLVEQFNSDTKFVLDCLLLQFEFWEYTEQNIFAPFAQNVAPFVQEMLRNKGLLFEGVIIK